jgi:branched-chain amino acid transport system permease protein
VNGAVVVQLGVDCVAAASLYALVALAVSLAYSGSGTYHLAIGQVGIAGGLIAAGVLQSGWPVWVAVVAGLAVGAALSAAMERGLVAPASGRPVLAAVLLIAAAVVTRELLQGLFPRSAYSFPSTSGTFRVLGGLVHTADLVTIAVVVAVAATGAVVLRSTTLGAALRLSATAPAAAERIGVDTARIRAASFAVGGALVAGAVLLGVARFPLAASGGVVLALRGIAAAAAGGMRSPARVVTAAVIIAAAQVVGGFYLGGGGEALSDVAAVLLIAAGWRR